MEFQIVRGNIIDAGTDAIVLPANERLKEGSGASAAIFEAAGRKQLKKACEAIGHCDTGSAVPTPAFDMNAKYIIHATVPRWKDGKHDEYGLLSSAYLTAMQLADIMRCESISFPLLASGNNGFDRELAFKIASESIGLFYSSSLKKIQLVVFNEDTECFVRSLGYTITEIEKTEQHKKAVIPEEAKKAIAQGLKIAADWLKDKEHQEKIIEFGINIALIVLGKDAKKIKAIEAVKKLLK